MKDIYSSILEEIDESEAVYIKAINEAVRNNEVPDDILKAREAIKEDVIDFLKMTLNASRYDAIKRMGKVKERDIIKILKSFKSQKEK